MPIVDHHRDPVVLLVDFVDERRQHVAAGVIAVLFEHRPEFLTPLRRQRALAEPRGCVENDQPPPSAGAKDVREPAAGDQ